MNILAHRFSSCPTCQAMVAEVERLRAELDGALHDPIWGIGTRQAIERRMAALTGQHAAIVLDVDNMHGANDRLGHAEVDRRIGAIFSRIRASDTYAGRWLRGDEIVVFCDSANVDGLAIRLLVLFEMHGLGATIVIAPASREGIATGIAVIEAAKRLGQRGQILERIGR